MLMFVVIDKLTGSNRMVKLYQKIIRQRAELVASHVD